MASDYFYRIQLKQKLEKMMKDYPLVPICPICEGQIIRAVKKDKRNCGGWAYICRSKECRKIWNLLKSREWFKAHHSAIGYFKQTIRSIENDNISEKEAKEEFEERVSYSYVILDNGDIVSYEGNFEYYNKEDESDESEYIAIYGERIKKPTREYIQNIRAEFLAKKHLEIKVGAIEFLMNNINYCKPIKYKQSIKRFSYETNKSNTDALRNHGWSDLLLS